MKSKIFLFGLLLAWSGIACSQKPNQNQLNTNLTEGKNMSELKTAVFGAGCFWCVEPLFDQLKGVSKVEPGYSGGNVDNPTYEQVSSGLTNHAEVIKIWYDPDTLSYVDLLEVLFKVHDPTTLNRQGNDVGTQYRSIIFYENDQERDWAEQAIKILDEEGIFPNKIVTEVSPLTNYFTAENYHMNYYRRVGDQNPYCTFVITPKVKKFEKLFKDKIR